VSSAFADVKLCIADGTYVTTVKVPKFVNAPDVLQWGSRIFQLQIVDRKRYQDEWWMSVEYHECFAYTVPEWWEHE
jgi:hypothetical protein